MLREIRDARRDGRGEDGMSLIELLVSMIVFSMAIALAFSAVILIVQKSDDVQKSADAIAELRLALAQIDRQVRSGNVLFSPEDELIPGDCSSVPGSDAGTCMRIFTQSNGDQKCVQWQVLVDPDSTTTPATYLLRTRNWHKDWDTGGGTVEPWRTVARDLHLGSVAPFTLSTALDTPVTPYGDRMLRVHLEAWDARREQPVSIDSSITGRNTSYGYDAGQCDPVPPA